MALFDEAQRAWDLRQTANFMARKKKRPGFNQSEPEFLISCLDRHPDWAVIVCLVGGGQEINTGEAGISEWIDSLLRKFPGWDVYISPRLTDSEYGAGSVIAKLKETPLKVEYKDELHLAVSMRSFRAERVSELVKKVLDLEAASAKETLKAIGANYPIVLTRDLQKAKRWLRILKDARKDYQKNAYRVLLTRARQGMVLVVPEGDGEDHTRLPSFYNSTYDYLQSIGFPVI